MADGRKGSDSTSGESIEADSQDDANTPKIDTPEVSSSENEASSNHSINSISAENSTPSRPVFGGSSSLSNPVNINFGSSLGNNSFPLTNSILKAATSSNDSLSPKSSLLRPSQLAVNSESTPRQSTSLSRNPFARPHFDNDKLSSTSDEPAADSSRTEEDSCNSLDSSDSPSSSAAFRDVDACDSSSNRKPLFMPLGSIPQHKEDSSSSAVTSSMTGFVFGQKLHERVVDCSETVDSTSSKPESSGLPVVNNVSSSSVTNGNSDLLFTSILKNEGCGSCNNDGERSTPGKSLSEAAREYEEMRSVKRKYDEVAVITGEEGENNILQLNCKLFAHDKNGGGNWVERGRGILRLNDKEEQGIIQSRVVMRTAGSLRVVLNTKIWGGMVVDKTSSKSVRLTAIDSDGQVKVYLVMASPKDSEQLYDCLDNRVRKQRRNQCLNEGDNSSQDSSQEPSSKKKANSNVEDSGGGWA